MAVRIRLRRIGKKKEPQYRLVVTQSTAPRDGRFIEMIGHYNPRVDPPAVSVNVERARWWLQRGAQPSDTARSMLQKAGVFGDSQPEMPVSSPMESTQPTAAEPAEEEVSTSPTEAIIEDTESQADTQSEETSSPEADEKD